MRVDEDRRRRTFERTHGRCHICRSALHWGSYGRVGKPGAWEVDHSRPRAKGGTDHGNNLYPACITCNRSKQARSTRSARSGQGYRTAPKSRTARSNAAIGWGLLGSAVGALLVPPPFRLVAGLIGAAAGVSIGRADDP